MCPHNGRARKPEKNDQLQILLVTGTLLGGGAERQIADMANYWVAKGIRITVATWSEPEIEDFYSLDSRVRRVHLNARETGRLRGLLKRVIGMRRLLQETRPDAVLSFLTQSNVPTIIAAVGLDIRIVVSERAHPAFDTSLTLVWRLLRRVLYMRADAVVAQTRDVAEWIRKHWRKRAQVIPNALRTLPVSSSERGTVIVGIGRLVPQKGFDLLLKAFARIASDYPEWRITIIGEGRARASLERLRDDLQLVERVDFIGHVEDVETWLARAGLVVQPSRFEGFPNVVLESMGMGAAVISAECPSGPAELIDNGVNGRLVPVENVAELARVMAELMSDPDLRARLGREAMKVRDRFRQEPIMAKWEALLLSS
jgi:glycosyltransferase involved in cell wall biosynthesis